MTQNNSMVWWLLPAAALLAGCPSEKGASQERASPQRSLADATERAEGAAFEVALQAPSAEVPVGEQTALTVAITARPGFKVNEEYPHNFKPEGGAAALKFEGQRIPLGTADATKEPCEKNEKEACALHAPLPFTATEAGSHKVSGTLSFSVCNETKCLIEKVPLALQVTATAAAPGEPAPN